VLGSRGFTEDLHYEILELVSTDVLPDHRNRTMFLYVPPPFIHPEVAMITEMNAPNFKLHHKLLTEWDLSERREVAQLSDEYKTQRSMIVWRLLFSYLEARREQQT
jgi:hypothetical protein